MMKKQCIHCGTIYDLTYAVNVQRTNVCTKCKKDLDRGENYTEATYNNIIKTYSIEQRIYLRNMILLELYKVYFVNRSIDYSISNYDKEFYLALNYLMEKGLVKVNYIQSGYKVATYSGVTLTSWGIDNAERISNMSNLQGVVNPIDRSNNASKY